MGTPGLWGQLLQSRRGYRRQAGDVGAPSLCFQLLEVSGDPLPAIGWEQCIFPSQMLAGTGMREASAGSTAVAGAGPEACELGKRARDPVLPEGQGSRQQCWVDRGAMQVLQGSVNVCVLVNLESAVCVPLVNFYLYQPEKRKGTRLSVSMLCTC